MLKRVLMIVLVTTALLVAGPIVARTLAIDPYESRAPSEAPPGALVCGWQLHDRVVLQRWDTPSGLHERLEASSMRAWERTSATFTTLAA